MADVVKPSKHGRDHCPGGEDPIPCLDPQWAFCRNVTNETINSTSLTTLEFTQYAIGAGVKAITINTGSEPFWLVRAGLYQFHMNSEWTNVYTDIRLARIDFSGAGVVINADSTLDLRVTDSDPYYGGRTTSFGPMYANCSEAEPVKVAMKVEQRSGSAKNYQEARLMVAYLGPAMGIPTWVDDWFDVHIQAF